MSTQQQDEKQTALWFVYLVTISLGMAFTAILISIAWDNSLDQNKRVFSLESVSLKESVSRNVRAADNAISNLSAFLVANQAFTQRQFEIVVNSILNQHPFIEGVIYSPLIEHIDNTIYADESEGNIHFPVHYQVMRLGQQVVFTDGFDLSQVDNFKDAMQTMLSVDRVVTAAFADKGNGIRNYWMFKSLRDKDFIENNAESSSENIQGLVALLVNTSKLLGMTASNSDLSVTMFNDYIRLSSRQLLYDKKTQASTTDSWSVLFLNDAGLTQFPMYSVKFSISKDIHWQEVEKIAVYIALLIGIGMTLLLTALVRAKDQQATELRERNIVIERKVEEQTKQLALARDQALDASKIKSEFLASMSHEIRTPLNAIIGMAELLSETPLTNEQTNYIGVFRKAGDTLLSLVNDILDLSKIEADQLVLEHISFNLIENIEESVEIYALKAAEQGIELLTSIDDDISPVRTGDPARLRQIVLNLISNALKFTDHGEIVVRIHKAQEKNDDNYLHFSVSDTGIGIPEKKLEAIFASFSQVDSSTTRKYGGTGLGLTISRKLTEKMDGKIWVESEEGKGSTFNFIIRLVVSEMPISTQKVTGSVDLQGKHILIVDDNATNLLILATQLSSRGAVVKQADSAQTALDILYGQSATQNSFDVILTDCHMPDMDGFDLIETMQAKGTDLNMIMMLSSADLNQHMSRADELGIGGYLIKPVKREALITQLGKVLSETETVDRKQVVIDAEQDDIVPLKILLVEDNPDNRLLIRAYLKKLPYQLDEAENGQIAVEMFQQSDYDLVFMDVQMPVMDGHQATRIIRAWEAEHARKSTPIIALTAHAIKEEIDKCMQAGCDTHLSKPVKKATILDTIKTYASGL
ncbi:MAG: response regulator [Proteobacteria bacterium]|nr:response regulator [Pseudomonadota bacterium]